MRDQRAKAELTKKSGVARRVRSSEETGSMSVLGAGVMAVMVVAMLWLVTLGRVSWSQARTQTAADMAALAGSAVVAEQASCTAAELAALTVLAEYEATLEGFECGQRGTRVVAARNITIAGFVRTVRAKAQAEVQSETPSGEVLPGGQTMQQGP